MIQSNPKRDARILLGLMDENLNSIHHNDQCREALLTTIELLKIRIKSKDAALYDRDNGKGSAERAINS